MGHLYPGNISQLMVELQKRDNYTTLRQVVNTMGWRHMEVSCAEGGYHERYMREMAAEMTLYWHGAQKTVRFMPETPAQRYALKVFSEDGVEDDWSDVVMSSSRHSRDIFWAMYDCPFHIKTGRKGFYHPFHIES